MKNSCPQSCPLFLSVPYRAGSLPLDSFEINLMDVVRICQTQESEGRKSPADKRIGGDRRQTQGHPFKHFQTFSNIKCESPRRVGRGLGYSGNGLAFCRGDQTRVAISSPSTKSSGSAPALAIATSMAVSCVWWCIDASISRAAWNCSWA